MWSLQDGKYDTNESRWTKKIDEFKIDKHRATSARQELSDMEKECKAEKKLQ